MYKAYIIELQLRKPKRFVIVNPTASGAIKVLEELHPGKEVLSIKTGDFVDYKNLRILDLSESTTDALAIYCDKNIEKPLSVIDKAVAKFVNDPKN